MVIVGGYETFVLAHEQSRGTGPARVASSVNASRCQGEARTAIIGISSIHLLKDLHNAAPTPTKVIIAQTRSHHLPASRRSRSRIDRLHAATAPAKPGPH
jgi:uncharacterized membrane protein YqhA